MSLWETFTLAVKNISGSKMRTFLTMLGIIIGVCAVIVIVGLGNGMAGYMEDSFAEMGDQHPDGVHHGPWDLPHRVRGADVSDRGGQRRLSGPDFAYCVHDRQCKDRQHHLQLHLRIRCRGRRGLI